MPETTTLAALTHDPQNRRRRTPRGRELLVQALQEVGAARSVVIDETGEILAGNGVVEAATAAGLTQVQIVDAEGDTLIAVRRRGLTPEQKRALALYDNRTAELAEWDFSQLAQDQAAGLQLQPFWTEAEEAVMFGTPAPPTWQGMPEFTEQDTRPWRTLLVHFKDQADLDAFTTTLGLSLSKNTKWTWYPPQAETVSVGRVRYDGRPEGDGDT